MKKHFFTYTILIALLITIFIPNNMLAGQMIDYTVDTDICRFSDHYDETNTLPYVRISDGRIEVDRAVYKSGLAISTKAINVGEDLSRLQVFVSQDRIDINKSVENAILISPNVVIDGEVSQTVIVFSQNLTLKENSNIVGEILAYAQNINLAGKVEGNVIANCYKVDVGDSAVISGGLRLYAGSLNISQNCDITGKVYCKSSNDILVPENHKEHVSIVKSEIKEDKVVVPFFTVVISSLIFGAICILINSKSNLLTKMNDKISSNMGFTLMSGLISIFVILPLILISIFLAIFGLSCVAIPIIIVMAAVMLLAISIRIFIVGNVIVESMIKTKYGSFFDSNLKKFILAVIIFISLQLFEYIPFVGTYILYLYVVISIGSFMTLVIRRKKDK